MHMRPLLTKISLSDISRKQVRCIRTLNGSRNRIRICDLLVMSQARWPLLHPAKLVVPEGFEPSIFSNQEKVLPNYTIGPYCGNSEDAELLDIRWFMLTLLQNWRSRPVLIPDNFSLYYLGDMIATFFITYRSYKIGGSPRDRTEFTSIYSRDKMPTFADYHC